MDRRFVLGAEEKEKFRALMRMQVTDGAVIGSKSFVNAAFANARERFGLKRKDGARRLRGDASTAAGVIWSLRDLKKGI